MATASMSLLNVTAYLNGKELGIITNYTMNRGTMETTYFIEGPHTASFTSLDLDCDVMARSHVIGKITKYQLNPHGGASIKVEGGARDFLKASNNLSSVIQPWHTYDQAVSAVSDAVMTTTTASSVGQHAISDYSYYKTEDEENERMTKLEHRLETLERYCLMLELAIKQAGIILPMNLLDGDE